jgi:hypothetical protein
MPKILFPYDIYILTSSFWRWPLNLKEICAGLLILILYWIFYGLNILFIRQVILTPFHIFACVLSFSCYNKVPSNWTEVTVPLFFANLSFASNWSHTVIVILLIHVLKLAFCICMLMSHELVAVDYLLNLFFLVKCKMVLKYLFLDVCTSLVSSLSNSFSIQFSVCWVEVTTLATSMYILVNASILQ